MSVLSKRDRNADARRAKEQAMLDATLELLGEGSAFAELGVEQIVRRAGFSRPTFYAYFEDKRDLVLKLGAALELDVAEATAAWLERGEAVPLRETISGVLEVFRRHRLAVRALVEAATYDADAAAFWRAIHERFMPGATERIQEGDPTLGPARAGARAYALVWMTERTLTEHLANPTVDEAALVDELAWIWACAAGTDPAGR